MTVMLLFVLMSPLASADAGDRRGVALRRGSYLPAAATAGGELAAPSTSDFLEVAAPRCAAAFPPTTVDGRRREGGRAARRGNL